MDRVLLGAGKQEKICISWRSNLKRRHSRLDYRSPMEYNNFGRKKGQNQLRSGGASLRVVARPARSRAED